MSSNRSSSSLGGSGDTLSALSSDAQKLGASLEQAFAKAAVKGLNFDATLKAVEKSLLSVMARAASRQLDQSFSSLFSAGASNSGGASDLSTLIPFAAGGIVTTPTIFGTDTSRALTGEAGPEAIMPLQRGPDGSLGLKGGGMTTVNVTIQTQDLESFRRSEAQIAAAMTRALQRGRRAM